MVRASSIVAALLASTLGMGEGRAQLPESGPDELRSPYEQEAIRGALEELQSVEDDAPDGKLIESIEVLPRDVIEPRDPLPNFLNVFHARSRPSVIERQILLAPGDRYDQSLVDESARNLRSLRQLSLVLLVPIRGSTPDHVRILVLTKDIWSLRLNSDFRFAGGRLERLLLQPAEENFFGLHHVASMQLTLDPASYSLGARYEVPRIAGSWILMRASANVIVNRDSGQTEGSYGSFAYGQPLYSTQAEWAWAGTFSWVREITRRFVAAEVATYDALATANDDSIPIQFRTDSLDGSYAVTRSFGTTIKHDFTAAMEVSRNVYRTDDLSAVDPSAAAEFKAKQVPISDTQIGPALQYRTYSTQFMRVLDFETLGLQEDYRLGHEVYVKAYPVLQGLGSSRDLFGVYVGAEYSVPMGSGIARLLVESTTEMQTDSIPDGSLQVQLRLVTPKMPIGRLVYDGTLLTRYENYLNRRSVLGGDTRPRGYATQQFIGKDLVAQTLELRTRPIELWSLQLGGAAFVESGDAFDGASDLDPKQSAGFGVRGLLPMFDRVVFRADWGFPLTARFAPPSSFPGDIVVTFKQAFPMPSVPLRSTEPY